MKLKNHSRDPLFFSISTTLLLLPVLLAGPALSREGKRVTAPRVVDPGAAGGAPSDAVVLFDGKSLEGFRGRKGEAGWKIEDGVLTVVPGSGDIVTRKGFGDVQLHLEWREPPGTKGSDEQRGNSGIKFHEAYEIQILDSYHNDSNPLCQAGAVYKQHAPLVNVCRKPGEWQSYDIVFRAPRFADQKLVKRGTLTVIQNGVLVQDHVEILGRTNSSEPVKPDYRQPLLLQDHGTAVGFRNIWLRELEPVEEEQPH
jgi:hypothetical protein